MQLCTFTTESTICEWTRWRETKSGTAIEAVSCVKMIAQQSTI